MKRTGTVAQQLEQAEAEVKELREQLLIEPFYEDLGRGIVMALQTIPFDDWPNVAKVAFRHYAQAYPGAAKAARERLPK